MELKKIILHYLDGRIERAYAPLFEEGCDPVPTVDLQGRPEMVPLEHLKAAFFVRSFTGNPAYDRPSSPEEWEVDTGGNLVGVLFHDGETIFGELRPGADVARGFYLTVLDEQDNNLLIYVNPASLLAPPREPEAC
ncbi:MAG: hypothetical protein WBS54_16720 [Acidobacteriota bacterium]